MKEQFLQILLSSEFLCFTFGLLLSISNILYRFFSKKIKILKFKKMIYTEYVESIFDFKGNNISECKNNISDSIEKLNYLKDNELLYCNSEGQFELIRIVEYTKLILKECNDYLNPDTFSDTTVEAAVLNDLNNERKINTCKNYLKQCENNIENYINLKTDVIYKLNKK